MWLPEGGRTETGVGGGRPAGVPPEPVEVGSLAGPLAGSPLSQRRSRRRGARSDDRVPPVCGREMGRRRDAAPVMLTVLACAGVQGTLPNAPSEFGDGVAEVQLWSLAQAAVCLEGRFGRGRCGRLSLADHRRSGSRAVATSSARSRRLERSLSDSPRFRLAGVRSFVHVLLSLGSGASLPART